MSWLTKNDPTGLFKSTGDFLFGTPNSVSAPYETDYARNMRNALEQNAYAGLSNYNPATYQTQAQTAYNTYNTNMSGLMGGMLPEAYNNQLNDMRNANLNLANRQIQEASGTQAGGLMSDLAKRGILSSSVTADSLNQIGKSAANAMSDAASRENALYSQNYLNGINQLANMNSTNLGNTMQYGSYMQNQALQPAQYLYGQFNSQEPIKNEGSPGLVGGLLGGLGQGLGMGAGYGLIGAMSDERLKDDIEYTGEFIDYCPVATWRWKDTGRMDIGFIAQDVQKIHPHRVYEGEDGFLRIKRTMFGKWPVFKSEGKR